SSHNHQATWWRYLRREKRKGHLISRSGIDLLSSLSSLTPDQPGILSVMSRGKRNDEDMVPNVPPSKCTHKIIIVKIDHIKH
ncbi:unnamed protein product, partial [Hymenolepis diminuta]